MTTRSPKTARPAKASKPFDLDAIEAEVAGEVFTFDYKGTSYTLPHIHDVDRRVLMAADQGEKAAMEELFRVGLAEEYEAFASQPMKLRTLNALFEAWLRHCGLEPGELRASTRS
ncbi:hypothetical protein [Planobispora rosea]|uniref:hypothetical protein n=1 Tax=Planobispora rosea TaxID=35762 RepID=UPI00083A6FA6|nr:hypothetical protein [Planobispora rosea]